MKQEVGVDDTMLSLLRFKNGVIAQMNHTWACPVNREARFQDVSYGPTVHGERIGNMRFQLEHFLKCVLRNEKPVVGVEEGLAGVKAALALEESILTGKPVYL